MRKLTEEAPVALFALLVVGVLVLAVAVLLQRAASVSDADVAWLAGAEVVPADEACVYRAYLVRHRSRRVLGGLSGVALAVVLGVRWAGSVRIGLGEGSPLTDVLFCGLAGTVLGAFSAEAYRLRPVAAHPAVASLEPRPPVARPGVMRAGWGVVGAALLVGIVGWIATGSVAALVMGLAGAALVAVTAATERAVRGRRRIVTEPRVMAVDARLREFAGEVVAWLALASAILAAGWVCALLPWDGAVAGWVGLGTACASLVGTVLALRRASPRPRRGRVAVRLAARPAVGSGPST
ncbi:hypothetical protein [Luteimicrobium sp. DT211]|uniref:hypothetical protein n=1 Tax=Luteimicrobium sp. DT211 TaxID=3393412 RepID=UPI003CF696B6